MFYTKTGGENVQLQATSKQVDCEQSLFCSKNPAGGAARKRVRYSNREPRAASSVGGRASERRAKRETALLSYCISEARDSGDGVF